MLQTYIQKTMNHQNLSEYEMKHAMEVMMEGSASPIQVSGLLTSLATKGESPKEIAVASKVMLEKAVSIETDVLNTIDIVGTGGDGLHTFNISTTCAFVLAGAGMNVAKHGNRGVSSKSGAADVLEALGANIHTTPNKVNALLKKNGIAFLFAQNYHLSMKNVALIRKELSVKTLFNILGPLTNPIRPQTYVIGAYDQKTADLMIEVYKELDVKNAVVFHGDSHMDEVSLTGPTTLQFLKNGHIEKIVITPEQFGFKCCCIEELIGGDRYENAKILLSILQGEKGPKRDIVLLNCGVALYCAGKANSIGEGIIKAKESIDSKQALNKLNRFIELSREDVL